MLSGKSNTNTDLFALKAFEDSVKPLKIEETDLIAKIRLVEVKQLGVDFCRFGGPIQWYAYPPPPNSEP